MNTMTAIPTETTPPQEVVRATQTATSVEQIVATYEIDSQEMYEAAADELQDIKRRHKEIEAQRVFLKEPYLEGGRRIDAFFKVPLERLDAASRTLSSKMLTYSQEQRRQQEEARRRAEVEAAAERDRLERERRAAEEEAAKASQAGDTAAAEAAAMRAEELSVQQEIAEVAPVSAPVVAAPKAKGISTRENWKAEVTSLRDLVVAAAKALEAGDETLLGYLQADTVAIGKVAKALKAKTKIPGVRVYNDEILSARSA